ncbi:MAG: putative negative regulator of RcsB-dependent stress response [Arenicella sp.]|jgi:predicted negative regulator of RcsB-dependent stress response
MADDIFLTPEEQDERARKWLKDNGPGLAIGIALGLAAIFGYEQYKDSVQSNAEQASALYQAALTEVSDSSLSDIDAQVKELKENYASSSYAAKAALLKAKKLSISDLDAAYSELQWVIDNAAELGLQHTARIRQAKIKLSQSDLTQARVLASFVPTQGFESNYSEILADVNAREGNAEDAREFYQKAIDTLPSSQSSYAQLLSLKIDRLPAAPAAVSADATE